MKAKSALGKGALLIAVALVASSCMVPNPPPTATVPANWGSGIAPTKRDVAYSSASSGCGIGAKDHSKCGGSTTLDIYRRAGGGSRGTIVFIHGGGSTAGDKSDRHEFGAFLRQTYRGWDVVSVNYRLVNPSTGANVFPAGMNDVSSAIAWLRRSGSTQGLNVSRIVTAGHSAGGTLAALAGVAANNSSPFQGLQRVNGYVTIGSVLNYGTGRLSSHWGTQLMLTNFKSYWKAGSPITYLDANDAPGYVIHADGDDVVEPANAYAFHDKATNGGFGANVRLDIVDHYSNGAQIPKAFRRHGPAGGANAFELDGFLNGL